MNENHVAKQNSEEPCAVVPQARICGSTGDVSPGATRLVSPRAKEVIDVLRIDGEKLIEIDEVFLYTRIGVGAPYRKIRYWKRDEDAISPDDRQNANSGSQSGK